MKYSQSADTVVYEEEPRSAAMLLARTAEYSAYPLQRGYGLNNSAPTLKAAAAEARCLARLTALIPQSAGHSGFTRGTGALAFLHERVSPAGHRRLVVVHYFPDRDTFIPDFIEGYDVITLAITPASLLTAPSSTPRGYFFSVLSSWPRHPPLVRMFAGQPDPADPSHFTIRYQMWGQEDVLDGKLNDDDTVTLTARHTPQEPKLDATTQ